MRTEITTPQDPVELSMPPLERELWRAGASGLVRVFDTAAEPVASCATWSTGLPELEGKRIGYIGRFNSTRADAGILALQAACGLLAEQGCQRAIGPIDGSTWHRYRLVTESSPEAPFYMEPVNPPDWPSHWTGAGFTPLASYHSSMNDHLELNDRFLIDSSARARDAGLSLRHLSINRFDQDMQAIYDLSLTAFESNFLYSPIGWEEFSGMYAGLKGILNPSLVLVCDAPDRPGSLAGYIMAFPDPLEHHRSGTSRTLILKSMAVHPQWRSVGLGTWLIAQAQANAISLGLSRAIFALMHDTNHSARISRHYSRIIRRYTLFARGIAE